MQKSCKGFSDKNIFSPLYDCLQSAFEINGTLANCNDISEIIVVVIVVIVVVVEDFVVVVVVVGVTEKWW